MSALILLVAAAHAGSGGFRYSAVLLVPLALLLLVWFLVDAFGRPVSPRRRR